MGNNQHAQAHDHPTPSTFVKIGAILFAITAVEFGIVYLEGMKGIIWAVLGILSVVKFILVVGYFMHLKFEHRFLSWVFAVGAVLAALILVALKFVNLA